MPFVEIQGMAELLHALDGWEALRDEAMAEAAQAAYAELKSALREYGPESPVQTYVRTFRLQAGWDESEMHYESQGSAGFEARATNPTSYGPYVQGGPNDTPHQARAFEDRWATDQQHLDDNTTEILAQFDHALQQILNRMTGA